MAGVNQASTDSASLLRRIVQLEHGSLFLLLAMLCGLIYMFLCSFLRTHFGDRSAVNYQSQGLLLRRTKLKPCDSPERDELQHNVEQLSTSQAATLSGVDIFSRIQGRRSTTFEQELQSCKLQLTACRKENTKLEEELSEVYIIKSKFAELLKKEVEKSAGLEKEVKFYQSRAAAALSDRDRAILDMENYKKAEDDMMEKMAELEDRLEETTVGYTEEKNVCANLKQELEKTKAENEVYQKVVERFWKVRERGTGSHDTEKVQNRATRLLQDAEDCWSFGEVNSNLRAQVKQAKAELVVVQEEFRAFSASVTGLQSQVEEENSARRQADNAVFHCKENMALLADCFKSERQQIQSAQASLKKGIASCLEAEREWLLSISKSFPHIFDVEKPSSAIPMFIVNNDNKIIDTLKSHPQQGSDETIEDLEDVRSSCNHANTKVAANEGAQDVVIEASDKMEYYGESVNERHIKGGLIPLPEDNEQALAQALQEKVAALLLLSQQEERQILEENTTSALQSQIVSLKEQLTQVTSEKVAALLDLAQLHQECKMLQNKEKNFKEAIHPRGSFSANGLSPIGSPVSSSEGEKNMIKFTSANAQKPSLQAYLKHMWLNGPELGPRSMSLNHILSLGRSKENDTVGIARLKVENASLRESLGSIRHLCNSANRLRLTIARVAADSSTQMESSIQAAVDAVDGVIAEALHLKVALHSSLPVNDLGWNSIGSPLSVTSDIAEDSSEGEANEDLDIVSFFGLEIVRLVLLAAQLQKRFLGQNV